MADSTAIEWTDATWNPVTGCTKISAGCDHCYAERFAERFRGVKDHPFEHGFDLTLRPGRLNQPIAWRRPRMIFVNSMSDLFHKGVPRAFVDAVFETMESADWHVFQVLTKRSSRMRAYFNDRYADRPAPAHIWMGVSVEDGTKLSRVRHLRDTAARVRFLSLEPLIGSIEQLDLTGMHWTIVGGESGPGRARCTLTGCVKSGIGAWLSESHSSSSNGAVVHRRLAAGSWTTASGTSGRTFRLLQFLIRPAILRQFKARYRELRAKHPRWPHQEKSFGLLSHTHVQSTKF